MFTNAYRKILGTIKQWFEAARLPTGPVPIPVKARIDASAHRRPMSIREYRIINQRCKR